MQLSSAMQLILLVLVVLFIVAIAGDIDTKEQIDKGALWSNN